MPRSDRGLAASRSMAAAEPDVRLGGGLLAVLSVAAALSVANIYYNQAMLAPLLRDFAASPGAVASLPMFSQIGYALGLLFLAPLGDRFERRRLIVGTMLALTAALAAAALAPGILWLQLASLLIGVFATVAQQIVPMVAALAPAQSRGRAIGIATGSVLLGILLARTVSGYVSDHWGWQAMFWMAAALMLVTSLVLATRAPKVPPSFRASYPQLLLSLMRLVQVHRTLRQAAAVQALLFAAFLAFWSTLGLLLAAAPFHLGGTAVGLISFAGAGGALAAPLVGRFADRRGPAMVVALGAALVVAAFAIFALAGASLTRLVIGTIVMDLGVQCALVSNQARIFALDPAARSRLNTVFMTTMFAGGALGSGAGSAAFGAGGWLGTCLFGGLAAVLALLLSAPAAVQFRR